MKNDGQRHALSDVAQVVPMKKCTKCAESKPMEGFYFQNGKPGSWCKACVCAAVRARESTPEGRKAARERLKKRRATEHGREKRRAEAKDWARKNGWYVRCLGRLHYEVAMGRIPRPSDAQCSVGVGCSGRHEWHHDSYRRADWLNVRCLCAKHHNEWHRSNKPVPFDGGEE